MALFDFLNGIPDGYKVVAVNTFVDLESSSAPQQTKKKKKSGPQEDPVPSPQAFDIPEVNIKYFYEGNTLNVI